MVDPMSPRLASAMVSSDASAQAARVSSSTARPREPWRSKSATCGLSAATARPWPRTTRSEKRPGPRRRRSGPRPRAAPGAGRCHTQRTVRGHGRGQALPEGGAPGLRHGGVGGARPRCIRTRGAFSVAACSCSEVTVHSKWRMASIAWIAAPNSATVVMHRGADGGCRRAGFVAVAAGIATGRGVEDHRDLAVGDQVDDVGLALGASPRGPCGPRWTGCRCGAAPRRCRRWR